MTTQNNLPPPPARPPYTDRMATVDADTQPFALPRTLIFLAPLWLIGSWLISIGLRQPIHSTSASYTPAVQMMLQCVLLGLIIAWPLYRLSQAATPYPVRQTIVDVLALAVLVQFVVWPLRILTVWPVERVLAIDAAMLGWTALAGAIVASALGSARSGPRHLAMIACIGLTVIGPLLAWILILVGASDSTLMRFSALAHVYTLSTGRGAMLQADQWAMVILVMLAAAGAWAARIVYRLIAQHVAGR